MTAEHAPGELRRVTELPLQDGMMLRDGSGRVGHEHVDNQSQEV
jgi:hypothetical protein